MASPARSRKVTKAKRPVSPFKVKCPVSLEQRVSRLELIAFGNKPTAAPTPRFINLDADGKPTTGAHVAVLDNKTGLTWSAESLQSGKELNHADAMKACKSLDLLGYTDWRAPTIEELLSIVDYTRNAPAIHTDHFKGPSGWTWSSTLYTGASGYAWGVSLSSGYSYWFSQGGRLHVRAVRAGQSSQSSDQS